ncbi:ABC transporter permease [Ruminococcus sp. AM45-9BH]|uniref:ABC transporter permease n=1 Tax=Blautia sp. TaxID=1955243 RepID=UPI000FED0A41|nr:ABC transporter permease [Blautia sp.]RHS60210.1 ABC transporter permease [Ruminococcus sp. AM45-9BH]
MRMQLYKMELYKIFHRKIFWIGILAILGLMFVYFWFAEVGDERCVIDGRSHSGYEAVQMNKKITEEYAGTVTDEKINQIVDKYGLPSELNESMPGWKDGNYLNDFVTRFFTNGSWENGVKPTVRYRLKDTDLWKAYKEYNENIDSKSEKNDKKQMKTEILSMWKFKPTLEYTTGWKVFGELLQFGLILGSIMIICVISGIFAEESQTKMLPLIFTTVEGKRKDTSAKVLASFTITVLLYAGITGSAWGLCKIVYDLKGGYNLTGVVISGSMWKTVDKVPFFSYLSVLLIFGMLAFLSLNAITLCISAYQDSMFGAVVATAICWAIPLLVRIFFDGLVWILVDSMPMFLIMQVNLNDIYSIWYVVAVIAVGMLAVFLTKGILHYKVKQVV